MKSDLSFTWSPGVCRRSPRGLFAGKGLSDVATDIRAQATASNSERLHRVHVRTTGTTIIVDVDSRVVKLHGNVIVADCVACDARTSLEIAVRLWLHRPACTISPDRGRRARPSPTAALAHSPRRQHPVGS